jgi:uncharacterized protein YdhG (YjbR/CyaY superfamily)
MALMRIGKSAKRASSAKRVAAPKSVDEYLSRVPQPARNTLKAVRAAIRSAVPREATEAISYGIPAFKYKGTLVWFAAFAKHCSFFPTAAMIQMFRKELKGYPISKGTIQFPVDRPLPAILVRKLVRARVAQVEKKEIARRPGSAPSGSVV